MPYESLLSKLSKRRTSALQVIVARRRGCQLATTVTVLDAGGKPSTWFPPEGCKAKRLYHWRFFFFVFVCFFCFRNPCFDVSFVCRCSSIHVFIIGSLDLTLIDVVFRFLYYVFYYKLLEWFVFFWFL